MDTLSEIKRLAVDALHIDIEKLDPDTPLSSLEIDSLTFVEFLFTVEERFGVSLPDSDVKDIRTLADLERRVSSALKASGSA